MGARAVSSMEGSLPPDIGDLSLSDAHQTLPLPGQTVQCGWILHGKAGKCPSSQL